MSRPAQIPAAWRNRVRGDTGGAVVSPRKRRRQTRRVIVLPESTAAGESFAMALDGWHPTKLNALINSNRFAAAKMKKRDGQRLADACLAAGVTRAKCTPCLAGGRPGRQGCSCRRRVVRMEIVLGPRQRAGDPDAYHKSVLDALVHCGALRDDSRTWCVLAPVTFDRADRSLTIVGIEDVTL